MPRSSVALLSLCAAALLLAACDSKSRGPDQNASTADQEKMAESADGVTHKDDAPAQQATAEAPEPSDLERYTADLNGDGPLRATIQTTMGVIECELHEEQAPVTVANFVGLARGKKDWVDPQSGELRTDAPFYDDVIFHRVIPGFMIQAGDRTGTGTMGPGYSIPDEIAPDLRHDKPGVLSMANKGEPNSGGSQWFITEVATPHLDDRHSVFGTCADIDVVHRIARVPTGPDNRPKEPPRIEAISFSREASLPKAEVK